MKAIESIAQILNYIDEHYFELLTIDDLAKEGHLSKYYLQRLFKDSLGITLEKYLFKRRLALSIALLDEGMNLSDVAHRSGFKSGAHYSRKFKETYDITPSEYKSGRPVLFHMEKPDVMLSHMKMQLNDRYVSDGMILEIKKVSLEPFSIIGVNVSCREGIGGQGLDHPAKAWQRFHEIKSTLPTITNKRHEYGVSHQFSNGSYEYLAGKPCDDHLSSDLYMMTVEGGMYYCCTFYSETFEKAVGENLSSAMGFYFGWLMERKDHVESHYIIENYDEEAFSAPHKIDIYAKIK